MYVCKDLDEASTEEIIPDIRLYLRRWRNKEDLRFAPLLH